MGFFHNIVDDHQTIARQQEGAPPASPLAVSHNPSAVGQGPPSIEIQPGPEPVTRNLQFRDLFPELTVEKQVHQKEHPVPQWDQSFPETYPVEKKSAVFKPLVELNAAEPAGSQAKPLLSDGAPSGLNTNNSPGENTRAATEPTLDPAPAKKLPAGNLDFPHIVSPPDFPMKQLQGIYPVMAPDSKKPSPGMEFPIGFVPADHHPGAVSDSDLFTQNHQPPWQSALEAIKLIQSRLSDLENRQRQQETLAIRQFERQGTIAPDNPSVHIGQVEVIIEAPTPPQNLEHPSTTGAHDFSGDLESRLYIRRI